MKFQYQAALLPCAPYSGRDPLSRHTLGVALQRQQGVHAIGTDRRTDFDTWPGTLAYTPPGVDVFSESATGGEYLVVRWCAEATAHQRLEWHAHQAALRGALVLRQLLLAPARDALAVEQATLRLIGLPRGETAAPDARLRATYRRVLDRIAAEFDQPLTIAELAAAENTTPLRFLREFSKMVGMTPHAFIVETRVQAARAMMRREAAPLSFIAADCGFAHQSHMGTAFRKLLGQTPAAYRAAILSRSAAAGRT